MRHSPFFPVVLTMLAAVAPAGAREKPPDRPAVAAAPAGGRAEPAPFTLTVRTTIPARPNFENKMTMKFAGPWAIFVDDEDDSLAVFDLRGARWFDWTRKQWITFKDAEAWAEASRKRSEASLEQVRDEFARKYAAATMDPKFKVEKTERGVRLSNEVLTYDVTARGVPKEMADSFFTHQRLSAFWQAMLERKAPPFPMLSVVGELEKRKLLPETMELTVRAKGTEQKLVTTYEITPAAENQKDRIAAAIEEINDAVATGAAAQPPPAGEAAGSRESNQGKAAEKSAVPF